MRKLIISYLIVIFLGLLPVSFVLAADNYGLSATQQKTNNTIPDSIAGVKAGENAIPEIIGKVVAIGLGLVGIAFFGLALFAGVTWMKAMGNSEEVTKAKDILEAAIIGLVLVLAAYAISTAVFSVLKSGSIGT